MFMMCWRGGPPTGENAAQRKKHITIPLNASSFSLASSRSWAPRVRQRAFATLGIAVLWSCGGGDGGTTTSPPPPVPGVIGPAALSYLNEVMGVMQTNSVNRKSIDWADFRQRVLADAAGNSAQNIAQTYPAI